MSEPVNSNSPHNIFIPAQYQPNDRGMLNKVQEVSKEPMNDVTVFGSGAVRSGDVKHLAYELISPIGLRRLAARYQLGAEKYAAFNCEKGMPISDLVRHAIAHCYQYLAGDRSDDHLAGAAWGFIMAMHSEELWPELNKNLRSEGCQPPVS